MSSLSFQLFSKIKELHKLIYVMLFEIFTIEMYMHVRDIFSLLKHHSKSINSLVTHLDLLQRNYTKPMLEMIEDCIMMKK